MTETTNKNEKIIELENTEIAEANAAESTESEQVTPKPYTFRKLCSEDVFLMFRIISKIGVKEFKACFEDDGIRNLVASAMGQNAEGGQEASRSIVYASMLLEAVDVIIQNIPKCEKEIYTMLAQTSNLDEKQVKALDMAVFLEMVIDFFQKDEFADFIKVVSKLFK